MESAPSTAPTAISFPPMLPAPKMSVSMMKAKHTVSAGIFQVAVCLREVHGEGGLTMASLQMGNALPTYSEYGIGYASEKAPTTAGWLYPVYEELWNYGIPQELKHFARAIRGLETPIVTGEHDNLCGLRVSRHFAEILRLAEKLFSVNVRLMLDIGFFEFCLPGKTNAIRIEDSPGSFGDLQRQTTSRGVVSSPSGVQSRPQSSGCGPPPAPSAHHGSP